MVTAEQDRGTQQSSKGGYSNRRSHYWAAASLISIQLLAGASTQAADSAAASEETTQLDEVVVTAEKRYRVGTDKPMSITALTPEDIQNQGVESVEPNRTSSALSDGLSAG